MHDHSHDYGHNHDHDHGQEPPPPGGELEARPPGDDSQRFHTGVHLRSTGDRGQVLVAVFPEVREGAYELLDVKGAPDAKAIAEVRVVGGEVCELDLR